MNQPPEGGQAAAAELTGSPEAQPPPLDMLSLSTVLLRNPARFCTRIVETMSVRGGVLNRAVSSEIDLERGSVWNGKDAHLDEIRFPMMLRAKHLLVDNLDTQDLQGHAVHTLPKIDCQQLACQMLQLEWDIAVAECGYKSPLVSEVLLSIPIVELGEASEALSIIRQRLSSAGYIDCFESTLQLAEFFSHNHVIWARAYPDSHGRFSIKHAHDTVFVPERGVRRLWPTRPNYLRHRTPLPFQAASYHFRMLAPPKRFFRTQVLVLDDEHKERKGRERELLVGAPQRPYAHLYANVPSPGGFSRRYAEVQLTLWEEPIGTAFGAFLLGLVSATVMTMMLLVHLDVLHAQGPSNSAAIILSLPATAAAWLGIPNSYDALSQMPRLSRLLYTSTSLNTIGAAVVASLFNITTVSTKAAASPVNLWSIWELGSLTLVWSLFLIIQLILLTIALTRTLAIWRGSRSLRQGI